MAFDMSPAVLEPQELTLDEIDEVNGGVVPFIIAVVVVDVALIAFTAGMADAAAENAKSE